jgi:hypothetical protein
MSFVKLNQKSKSVDLSEVSIGNPVVFSYFDSLSVESREESFLRALYIGVLALKEDRLSSFLAKTSNELGAQLESLKMIFDLKQELFFRTTAKGFVAEGEIADFLTDYVKERKLDDRVELLGGVAGSLKRNKTGDIVCHLGGDSDRRIVVECKFDKSLRLGPIEKRDVYSRKSDTVWSQLIEAQANRQASIGIIVFDRELVDAVLLNEVEHVKLIAGVGIIVIIDSRKGDFTNLGIGYSIARDFALANRDSQIDTEAFNLIVRRIAKDVADIMEVKALVEDNILNNKKILERMNKNVISLEHSAEFLRRFVQDGTLSKGDLLDFYQGVGLLEKLKATTALGSE